MNFFRNIKVWFNKLFRRKRYMELPNKTSVDKKAEAKVKKDKLIAKLSIKGRQAYLFSSFKYPNNFRFKEQLALTVRKIRNRAIDYKKVEALVGVPWEIIASLHMLECGGDLKRQLLNGEKWCNRTLLVPKGLGPFKNFDDSCIEAFKKVKNTDWSVAGALEFCERWNGLGYRKWHKDVNTPYLWSYTNHYTSGKYTFDGKFDASAVSKQIGVAPILKELGYEKKYGLAEAKLKSYDLF